MLQFQTQDGMAISHTLTRGKGTVCPADCNETAYPQEGSLTLAKKALKNQRCETPGPSRAQRFSGNTKCIPWLIYIPNTMNKYGIRRSNGKSRRVSRTAP